MNAKIAILTNDRHQVFQRDVIAGAAEVARARGYETAVTEIPEPSEVILATAVRQVRGALIIATVLPDAALKALAEDGLALTLVSHQLDSLVVPAVIHDNYGGISQLVAHLVRDCQRRKPVFIRGEMSQRDARERERAFREALMHHALGVPDSYFLRGDFEPKVAARSLERFLERGEVFNAIVAADYLMAVAALKVLRRAGLNVPQEISVVGFGDGPEAAEAGLTTVAADVHELGRRAARQLIGQIEGLTIRGLTVLSTQLVRRDTSC